MLLAALKKGRAAGKVTVVQTTSNPESRARIDALRATSRYPVRIRGMRRDEIIDTVVECDAIGAAIAALHEAPGVQDVAAFGNSLHILADSAATAIATLPAYLAERGIAVTRIEQIQPTIEDIFVQIIGAEAKAPRA